MQQLFSILQQVDSTNNYAMAAIRKGLAMDGSCWFAWHQTGGKGQRGKLWENKANENIAMSIAVKSKPLYAHNLFNLSALVSVAVRNICAKYSMNNAFTIKWPNDIYFGDKKAAGILIETILTDGKVSDCVIGIGINVNQDTFAGSLPNPISLKMVSKKPFDIIEMAMELHTNILQCILSNTEVEILREYNLHLYKKGQEVKLKHNNAVFETTIQNVTKFGNLITKDVMEKSFEFGQISWEK